MNASEVLNFFTTVENFVEELAHNNIDLILTGVDKLCRKIVKLSMGSELFLPKNLELSKSSEKQSPQLQQSVSLAS